MANHKSALKRARQSEDRRIRNRAVKTRIKNVVKGIRSAVAEEAKDTVGQDLNNAKSIIAKAAKKGIIHKKTAARKISRLSKHVNTLSA
ncbi:30S ribosomal protein S20 [Desulfobacterales bacterium HSG17]|nr:30S ribosomal protein S20 [Desulfobacterales bacterium HSG17]